MKINLNARKIESQWWQDAFDNFWKNVTPLWFDWLQWILVLGVINFLAKETESLPLTVVSIFSYLALIGYLQSMFFSIQVQIFAIKSKRAQRIIHT